MANAGSQLYTVAHKLHQVERSLDVDDIDDICVLELMESMTEVKNEYQNLRKDIQEVQQLQRDVSSSIRNQMWCMQQTFRGLKKRLEIKATQAQNGN